MHFPAPQRRLLAAVMLLLLTACQTISEQTVVAEPEAAQLPPPNENLCDCSVVAVNCKEAAAVPAVESCPNPQPVPIAKEATNTIDDLLVVGRVEYVEVIPDDLKLKARIDTGAGVSSMHARDLIAFERDGKPWVRFSLEDHQQKQTVIERRVKRYISIKRHVAEPQRRPVVAMTLALGSVEEQVDVTLTDRSDYLYPILIGRNFLRDRIIVDVSKKFTVQ